MPQNLDAIINDSIIKVKPERYAYLKCNSLPGNTHFMVSQDEDEVTVVTTEHRIKDVDYIEETKWFKLLEINVSMPFIAKGFLAAVTRCVAAKNLNVLIVSTYSKDYALVKEEALPIAMEALKQRGFIIHKE
jgi:hypothetical protein